MPESEILHYKITREEIVTRSLNMKQDEIGLEAVLCNYLRASFQ